MDQGPPAPAIVAVATPSASHGRIGILGGSTGFGVEGEVGTPFPGVVAGGDAGLGVGFFPDRARLDYVHSALWLRFEEALGSDIKAGALAGIDHDFLPMLCTSTCTDALAPSPLGILIGGFFEITGGGWRLRLAPSVSLILLRLFPPSAVPWHARPLLMGPPWIEVGYQLGPDVEIKFRSALRAPLGIAYRF